jgi:hypothetical protein
LSLAASGRTFWDHRQFPISIFRVKISSSEPLKRVIGRILELVIEANKKFKIRTTVSYSKL